MLFGHAIGDSGLPSWLPAAAKGIKGSWATRGGAYCPLPPWSGGALPDTDGDSGHSEIRGRIETSARGRRNLQAARQKPRLAARFARFHGHYQPRLFGDRRALARPNWLWRIHARADLRPTAHESRSVPILEERHPLR